MRRVRSHKKFRGYERSFEEDFEQIAQKYGVDKEQLKDNFYESWYFLKESMEDPRMPRIKLPWIGTFTPTVEKFNFMIKLFIRWQRRGKGDPEAFWRMLKRIWPVRARLIQEKFDLVPSTWKLWRDQGSIGKEYIKRVNEQEKE